MLAGRKNLAHTSSTPGKTRLINHFLIDDAWYLADLPGYGYARVPQAERVTWPALIRNYLLKRRNLLNTYILVDIRLEPQSSDLDFIRWMGQNKLPFVILFTKCDKLSAMKISASVAHYRKVLAEEWEELPSMFQTSSFEGEGRQEVLTHILETNRVFG